MYWPVDIDLLTLWGYHWCCVYVHRAVNNALLDTYQLKSLDAVLEAQIEDVDVVKTDDGRYKVQFSQEGDYQENLFDNFAMREPYDVVISCLGWTFDDSIFSKSVVFLYVLKFLFSFFYSKYLQTAL